jgi:hypothetical protein
MYAHTALSPMNERLITVVETRPFQQRVVGRLSDEERLAFIAYIAAHPEAGGIVPATGGVRKVRWGVDSRGKRGGVRVMYYYHNEAMPIFLLDVFAKNEKDDMTPAEKKVMRQLIPLLVRAYRGRIRQ